MGAHWCIGVGEHEKQAHKQVHAWAVARKRIGSGGRVLVVVMVVKVLKFFFASMKKISSTHKKSQVPGRKYGGAGILKSQA